MKQRLYAQSVPRQKQLPLGYIIERKGEHAMQPRHTFRSPLAIGFKNDFAVTVGAKGVAQHLQFAAQFLKIIDLAVEHQRQTFVTGQHRLCAAAKINDRQAAMAKTNTRRCPYTCTIRATVGNRVVHPLDPNRIDRL